MMQFLLFSNSLLFMALVASTMVSDSWAFNGGQNLVSSRSKTTRPRTIVPLKDMLDGNPQWYEEANGSNNRPLPTALARTRTRSATTATPREFGDIGVKAEMKLSSIKDQGIVNRQLCYAAERFIKHQSGYFSPMRPHDNPNMVVNVDYNNGYNGNGGGNYMQNPNSNRNNNNYNANNNNNNYNQQQQQQQQRGSNKFNNNYNANNNNYNQQQQQQQQQQRGSNMNNNNYNANNNNNYNQRGSNNNNNNYKADNNYNQRGGNKNNNSYSNNYNQQQQQQRGRYKKPLTQKELELIRNQRIRSTILADDFVFKGPVIGPLNKPDYVDVVDNYFKIYEAFPDLNSNCYGFTVDVVDPLTVRFFVKATGTYQQPLENAIGRDGSLLGKATSFMTGKPDGRRYVGATEAWSITFNSLERMQVRCLRGGYVVGEAAGGLTTAQGKDSIFGLLTTLGVPVPSLSDLKFQKHLGNSIFKTSGRLFPKTSSSKNKLPRWWRERLN
jgi:hypothetical protein